MRRLFAPFVVSAALFLGASAALAHSALAGANPAEAVPPGRCALRYDVLSQDGHVTWGTITFTAAER